MQSNDNSRYGNLDNDAMSSGGKIELPFQTAYIWVLNGTPKNAQLAQVNPALYFGGWAATAEEVDALFEKVHIKPSKNWIRAAAQGKDLQPFDEYTTRAVSVAVIGMRESWMDPNRETKGRRVPTFTPGWRRHVQALSWLFFKGALQEGEQPRWIPLFPIVLSAKGYQAGNLVKAVQDWKTKTVAVRRKLDEKLGDAATSARPFIMQIGTFGDKVKQQVVGKKGGNTSPITPIELNLPEGDKLTPEWMESRFVGEAAIEQMLEHRTLADEWLLAWRAEQDVEVHDTGTAEPEPEMNPAAVPAGGFDDEM